MIAERVIRSIRIFVRTIVKRLLQTAIEQVVRDIGRKDPGAQPNVVAIRFRDLELAVRNVNRLATHIAQSLQPQAAARLTQPSAYPLLSEMCKQSHFESDWLRFWIAELGEHFRFDRKLWEFCFIAQALYNKGMLSPGRAGLGFGCGAEALPSVFAKYGATVLATDLFYGAEPAVQPPSGFSHPIIRDVPRRRDICPDHLLTNIQARPLDMNAVPEELNGQFDFCWSSCALEHLGSIGRGMRFIERSLETLKPGGVAVHTTEFVLDGDAVVDAFGTVLFGEYHLREIAERAARKGCMPELLNFDPGNGILDKLVALATHADDVAAEPDLVRIKVSLTGFPCTSFGLIFQKADVRGSEV